MSHHQGQHYINGSWINGEGPTLISTNPSNASILWEGVHGTETEIVTAFHAAFQAFKAWSQQSLTERIKYIENFAKQIEKHRVELSLLISQEAGKPLWESATEVSSVISKAKFSIQAIQERNNERHTTNADESSHLRYKPHGVMVVLGPFNFPAHLSNGHIIPALLAGNTILYKPSELTPAVAALVTQYWHDSGLPPGVLNTIQGGKNTATRLLHQDIQGVLFTGSLKTGLKINQFFSQRPDVLLALEMGGNNPLLIDTIDNLTAAVYNTILSSFITAGQRCTCARRVLIADNAKGDQFLSLLINTTQTLRVGPYTEDPEPFMGPVIRYEQALKHLEAQKSLQNSGGNLLTNMSLISQNTGLLTPGIIDMTQVKHPKDEEIFAPLIQIHRYNNFEHALELANQTRYGLVAGLLSNNQAHYHAFYHSIRAGLINWNKPTTGAVSNRPFGGVGLSGNHRPSAYFATDYCNYPITSLEQTDLTLPAIPLPGIDL